MEAPAEAPAEAKAATKDREGDACTEEAAEAGRGEGCETPPAKRSKTYEFQYQEQALRFRTSGAHGRLCPSAAAPLADAKGPDGWMEIRVLSDPSAMMHVGVGCQLWAAGCLLSKLLLEPWPLGLTWCARLLSGNVGADADAGGQIYSGACENAAPVGLRVLELGAGTAVPSVCLARCGHRVVATDIPQVVPLTRANLEANSISAQTSSPGDLIAAQAGGRVVTADAEACVLAWGNKDAARALGDFDLVIGADLFYDPSEFEPLLVTLRAVRARWMVLAVVQRPEDLGLGTFENFCYDEGVSLRCLHTAVPGGLGSHRVNIYEVEDLGMQQDGPQS